MQLPKPLSASLSKEKIAKNFPIQFPVENFDEDLDNDDLEGIEDAQELPGEE